MKERKKGVSKEKTPKENYPPAVLEAFRPQRLKNVNPSHFELKDKLCVAQFFTTYRSGKSTRNMALKKRIFDPGPNASRAPQHGIGTGIATNVLVDCDAMVREGEKGEFVTPIHVPEPRSDRQATT